MFVTDYAFFLITMSNMQTRLRLLNDKNGLKFVHEMSTLKPHAGGPRYLLC